MEGPAHNQSIYAQRTR